MKEQIEEMAFDLCRIDTCKHLSQEECNKTTCAHCEAEALYNAGYRKQSEVALEIVEKIERHLARFSHIHRYAEEAEKVTEEYADGSPVEMTSVWDACRLEHNGYDDYETMCKLQDNIQNIAMARLLKELEVDLAVLKKEITEG